MTEWPKDESGTPKPWAQLTPEEREEQARAAAAKLQAELNRNRDGLNKVLDK